MSLETHEFQGLWLCSVRIIIMSQSSRFIFETNANGGIHPMNLYEAEYQSKRVTIEEALDSLKDGDVIGTSQCANEPTAFFDRPSPQQRKALPDVCAHVLLAPSFSLRPHLSEYL